MGVQFNINRYTWDFLKLAISKQKIFFTIVIITILSVKVIGVFLPILMGKIIDSINQNPVEFEAAQSHLIGFSAVLVSFMALNPINGYNLNKFVQNCIKLFTLDWVSKILNKDLHYLSQVNVGKLVSSTDRGIVAHEKLLGHFCRCFIPLVLEVLITVSFLIYISGVNYFALVALIIAIQSLLTRWIIKVRRKNIEEVNDAEDGFAGELTEMISNGLIFNIENKVKHAIKRLEKYVIEYAQSSINLAKTGSILNTIQPAFINFTTLVMLLVGLYAIESGELTIGALVSILAIASRLSESTGEFLESMRFYDQFQLDIKQFLTSLKLIPFKRRGLKINNFEYLTVNPIKIVRGENVFEITRPLRFNYGEKVAIIGPTGGGKSTLLDLIMGVAPDYRKSVMIDETLVENLDSDCHLSIMRYCPQKPYILSGCVADGVFFDKNLTLTQKSSMLSLELENSLLTGDRILTERATNISGGEAKRLSLSRVLSQKGKINIFDEPTTALNDEVSKLVWDRLFKLMSEDLVICTTHDYSELHRFDRVIVVKEGKIISDTASENRPQF